MNQPKLHHQPFFWLSLLFLFHVVLEICFSDGKITRSVLYLSLSFCTTLILANVHHAISYIKYYGEKKDV